MWQHAFDRDCSSSSTVQAWRRREGRQHGRLGAQHNGRGAGQNAAACLTAVLQCGQLLDAAAQLCVQGAEASVANVPQLLPQKLPQLEVKQRSCAQRIFG
jgi:hypothetical protein